MIRPIKTKSLLASTVATVTQLSAVIIQNDLDFTNLLLKLNVTSASGTNPTLDVYFQESLDGGTTFLDVLRFNQVTASSASANWASLAVGANDRVIGLMGNQTIAASSVGVALVSNVWQIAIVVGGTGPQFTFTLDAFYS